MSERDFPMTRPAWTAGPWDRDRSDWRCIRADNGYGQVIAEVMSPPHENGREDARLIAAAPALASALADLWDAHDKGRLIDDGLWDAARQALEAAGVG